MIEEKLKLDGESLLDPYDFVQELWLDDVKRWSNIFVLCGYPLVWLPRICTYLMGTNGPF